MVARSGQTINGYELHEKVAETGFAMVYRATQVALKREVAVKIIHPQHANSAEFMARFDQEAKIIARLDHLNIVPLIDYWRDQAGAYLVMRWMKGGTLREKLQGGSLKVQVVVKLLDQIGAALVFAHQNRVVHRDIKPENILLDELGNAYLADFGIAKDLSVPSITPRNEIPGTPQYLSPEQFDGRQATSRSDIFSLGIVLYELLTATNPFTSLEMSRIIYKRFNEPMPPLSILPPELSLSLDKVIRWSTEKDPDDRCPEISQLVEAFRSAALNIETKTAEVKKVGPPLDTPPITPIFTSDLKARLYQKPGLIPDVPRRLFGRDELVAQIHRHLDEANPVLLHGMGGMGKTSLAATVADQRIRDGKGDVIWLEAGDEDAETLCEAIARTFNQQEAIARTSGEDRFIAVRELLLDKNALLVLDNVWKSRALHDLMKFAVPQTMPLLVTSRQQATADGALIDVNALEAEDALNLLGYHADKDLSDDASAQALCQLLGSHPFALEIAGKRLKMVPHLTPVQLMKSIADAPHDLKLPPDLADVGREGVKDLLDDSVNELNEESRAVFTAMGSLFAPTATLELLALAMQRDIEAVEEAVIDLQQRGLAEIVPEAERIPMYYRLHDLTYSYARALFAHGKSDNSATITAARQFIQSHLRDFDNLEFEQNNLLGAANAARRKDDLQSLIDIMRMLAVDGYLDARGHSLLFLQRLDDAVAAAETLKLDETRHYLLGKRGNTYALRGDLQNALQAYEAALKLAPNPNREALSLSAIGGIRFQQNADDYDSYFERAYQLAETNEDDLALSHVLDNRGLCAKEKGDLETAHRYMSQAVEVAERMQIPGLLLRVLYNLGMVQFLLAQFNEALRSHQRVYTIAEGQNNHLAIANAYSGMACAYHGLSERDMAQEFFDKALESYRRLGAIRFASWVISFMEKENYTISPESD